MYEKRDLSEILRFEDGGKYLVHLTPLSGVTRLEVHLLVDRWKGNYPPLLIEKAKVNRNRLAVTEDYKLAVILSLDNNDGVRHGRQNLNILSGSKLIRRNR